MIYDLPASDGPIDQGDRLDLLRGLCASGKRRGRIRPLYREHLAKHFADTFSRIGLPRPYETL